MRWRGRKNEELIPVAIILMSFLLFASSLFAAGPGTITYQGTVTTTEGTAPPDGPYAMRFALWDVESAGDVGTNRKWQETHTGGDAVQVTNGTFSVEMGSVTAFPANLFQDYPDLWLEVEVDLDGDGFEASEVYSPRVTFTAEPYAFQSDQALDADTVDGQHASAFAPSAHSHHSLDAADGAPVNAVYVDNDGNVGIGTINPTCAFDVTGTTDSSQVSRPDARHLYVHLTDLAENMGEGPGIGFSNSGVIQNIGAKIVHIRTGSQSIGDLAFYTKNTASWGDYATEKMRITANGNVGIGTATPEQTLDVHGRINISDTDAAIHFDETAGGAGSDWLVGAFGGDFRIGQGNITTDNRLFIEDGGNVGIGTLTPGYTLDVAGTARASGDVAEAIRGETSSTSGSGVYGNASAASGTTYGVEGRNQSTAGAAGYFLANNNSGSASGVYGRGDGDNGYGVAGHAYYGGVGVGAWSYSGNLIEAYDGDYPGGTLRFYIIQSGMVYADAGYAVFKKVSMPGKSEAEHCTFYAMESPEAWSEDFGKATLVDGQAVVTIEPLFAQTVNLSEDYHVFVTPVSEEPVLLFLTEKKAESFTVRGVTLDGQAAQCQFDYRIVAKPQGQEKVRLARVDIPEPVEIAREKDNQ